MDQDSLESVRAHLSKAAVPADADAPASALPPPDGDAAPLKAAAVITARNFVDRCMVL